MSSKSTTKATLGLIPYLNCEPFHAGLADLDLEIVHEVPSELGRMAGEGAATCGPMAVADWFPLRDRFEPLEDFGIACEGPAHSVLLFARRDLTALSGARVGLTRESSTSVRLLELILTRKLGLEDVALARGASEDDDARLVIGDEALRAASEGLGGFPFVFDLGSEWHGWQGLPFVFARWVVSTEVPPEERRLIAAAIGRSLDGWKLRVPEIAARRGAEFGLDGDGVLQYLSNFRYRLGPVETMGERMFEAMLEETE
jgi:chorismate dehydratase